MMELIFYGLDFGEIYYLVSLDEILMDILE